MGTATNSKSPACQTVHAPRYAGAGTQPFDRRTFMNSKILKLTGACLTAFGLAATTPIMAQSTGGGGGGGGSTGGASGQTYSADQGQDNKSHNWSWIGLLGLLGLMGMRGRKHDDEYRSNSNNNRRPA
jgi:hypothetical protein